MGSFPSRDDEQAAIESAAIHYEFYEWASICLVFLTLAGLLLNTAELYVILSTPSLRENTTMILVAGNRM